MTYGGGGKKRGGGWRPRKRVEVKVRGKSLTSVFVQWAGGGFFLGGFNPFI